MSCKRCISATDTKITLEQNLFVERGIELRLNVIHKDTAIGIGSVPVQIYNRYGAFQRATQSLVRTQTR